MASNNLGQNNNGYGFRPQYGRSGNNWSSSQPTGTRPYNSIFNSNNRDPEQHQQGNFTSNNNGNQRKLSGFSMFQRKAKNDETTAYAVNLQLKPVEKGIIARNAIWKQEFQGLGAFNHYFGLCAPTKGLGYNLSDIWDGYFHITLAKFFTRLTPEQLEEVFSKFNPSSEVLPAIVDTVFRATTIKTGTGEYRREDRRNIDFVVLPIDSSTETNGFYEKVQPLLEKIEKQVKPTVWNVTPLDKLHVTVRKYSKINFELNKIKIEKFPLEFQCSHLEVKQSREQATSRFKQNNTYRWWTGVTEIEGKCSGCNTPVMSDVWEGFCLACGKYESLIPIWSTDGKNIFYYHQILQQEFMGNNNNI